MNIDKLRRENMAQGIRREDLSAGPFHVFEKWFEQANKSGIPEPNAMSLSTVSHSGQPWLRTVLLKLFDEQGFVFFTNYSSRKAQHILANPKVALLFPWVGLARQVSITGAAEKIPLAESVKYFATRPRGSQIGAWASHQSKVVTSRSLLEAKFNEIKQKYINGEVPLPSFWGGFRVVPETIEFWQGAENRLHDRFEYSIDESGAWRVSRLAP